MRVFLCCLLLLAPQAWAVEEVSYSVLEKQEKMELRQYNAYIVAETRVSSQFSDAGGRAFRRLFGYISGKNRSVLNLEQAKGEKIAMTSPVQQRSGEKIAMTTPVQQRSGEKMAMTSPVQQRSGERVVMASSVQQGSGESSPANASEAWLISFVMPASYSFASLPEPNDKRVYLREIPAQQMASIRYSGMWSEKGYSEHKRQLEAWINAQGLVVSGEATWARYDPPMKPWFLRRNEVLIPVVEKDVTTN